MSHETIKPDMRVFFYHSEGRKKSDRKKIDMYQFKVDNDAAKAIKPGERMTQTRIKKELFDTSLDCPTLFLEELHRPRPYNVRNLELRKFIRENDSGRFPIFFANTSQASRITSYPRPAGFNENTPSLKLYDKGKLSLDLIDETLCSELELGNHIPTFKAMSITDENSQDLHSLVRFIDLIVKLKRTISPDWQESSDQPSDL